MRAGSENASRLATMSSDMRTAGRVVKSKEARKDGVEADDSWSSLGRFVSTGSSFCAEDGRFRLSTTGAGAVAFRFFSSVAAFSIRYACCVRASLIWPLNWLLVGILGSPGQ